MEATPILSLGPFLGNTLFMKREDLIPYSFGGNKARKAELFFEEIRQRNCDCVVTYGSGSSNHCRIVANWCCGNGLPCYIISPEEASESSFNSRLCEQFGAEISIVPVDQVHETIENKLAGLREAHKNPYFIEGGGHGNIGTEAYVRCYREIREQEQEMGVSFDYIFLASGTGTTHAGLVCGQLLSGDMRQIVGISIARANPRGREVVLDSIRSYLGKRTEEKKIQAATVFIDEYISGGYGTENREIESVICHVMEQYGIPLDPVYTGKAFWGMSRFIEKNGIQNQKILFLHTGGTPLFFDMMQKKA